MNEDLFQRLSAFRADYAAARGTPFEHFFCPILFEDEPVPLCRAHVVNEGFPNSDRAWTVQRQDVDNFYGSAFESDFIDVTYKTIGNLEDVFLDKNRAKRLRPQIALRDRPIDFYYVDSSKHEVPANHTRLNLVSDAQTVELALKMSPSEFLAVNADDWAVSFSKDLRCQALVSLVKSAHLTLFELVGYNYALSAGGSFVGRDILGRFFREASKLHKPETLSAALKHFEEFVHMVRPIRSEGLPTTGTITDRHMLVCGHAQKKTWAIIVFVRTADIMSAVLVPVLENVEAAARYSDFLRSENESIKANWCKFNDGAWMVDPNEIAITWPKSGFSLR